MKNTFEKVLRFTAGFIIGLVLFAIFDWFLDIALHTMKESLLSAMVFTIFATFIGYQSARDDDED